MTADEMLILDRAHERAALLARIASLEDDVAWCQIVIRQSVQLSAKLLRERDTARAINAQLRDATRADRIEAAA